MNRPEVTWDEKWKIWEIDLPGGGKFGSSNKGDVEEMLDAIERNNRPIGNAYSTMPVRR